MAKSQSLALMSAEQEARVFPNGSNTIPVTDSVWPECVCVSVRESVCECVRESVCV